jgi:hypothetical protein
MFDASGTYVGLRCRAECDLTAPAKRTGTESNGCREPVDAHVAVELVVDQV